MEKRNIIPRYDILEAPYIRIDAEVRQVGVTNGKPNIKPCHKYVIAPSAKKIATYMVNQIFGSDLVTQTEGLQIGWLMPTLKESLELAIYEIESFVYIHKFDNKIYLECFKKSEIHDLIQKFDKIVSCKIIQSIDYSEDTSYKLERKIKIEDGTTFLEFKAFEIDKHNKETEISIDKFNLRTGSDYSTNYILPYEVLINIDSGEEFFKDSKKLLNEEMVVINTIADEIEKTKTRIATSQHFQSGDIVTNWVPQSTHYKVDTLTVGKMQDYFTLLPGDKDHQLFEFLQGNVRVQEYITTFKFYDQQIIQMAGLSPASFGYEKDSYMNTDNVNLSKNNSEMTVEALKTQLEPQINKLIENIIKAQQSEGIEENVLPIELSWDYGANEKFDDMKKLQVLSRIQGVSSVPYNIKAKIIQPILAKLIDEDYVGENKKAIDELIEAYQKERDDVTIKFGEV